MELYNYIDISTVVHGLGDHWSLHMHGIQINICYLNKGTLALMVTQLTFQIYLTYLDTIYILLDTKFCGAT